MLIGFSGKAGAGKTTLAEFLIDEFHFKKLSFAKAVKEHGIKYFGLTEEDIKKKPPVTRQILQGIGNYIREEFDKDYWINSLEPNPVYLLDNGISVVIDDVRFKNEADYIKKMGGIMIRIERPGVKKMNHPSETELDNYDKFDLVINNDKDLQYLIYNFSDWCYENLVKTGRLEK